MQVAPEARLPSRHESSPQVDPQSSELVAGVSRWGTIRERVDIMTLQMTVLRAAAVVLAALVVPACQSRPEKAAPPAASSPRRPQLPNDRRRRCRS